MPSVVATILSGAGARLVPVSAHVEHEAEAAFVAVGLGQASREALYARVRAAVLSSGMRWPSGRVVVDAEPGVAGAWDRGCDLAVGLAVLAADGQLEVTTVERWVAIGGLRLDGRLDPVAGVLARFQAAAGLPVVLPAETLREISPALAPGEMGGAGGGLLGAHDLRSLVITFRDDSRDDTTRSACRAPSLEPASTVPIERDRAGRNRAGRDRAGEDRIEPDLADVAGEARGRWALEVAAAGGHHLLLGGPPGAGKTMLAERLAGLLPDLPPEWAAEVAAVASAADSARPARATPSRPTRPPVRQVGPMTSRAALAGGAGPTGRPGLVSLAHRGVLVAEDLWFWDRRLLLVLREALDRGWLEVARGSESFVLPACFQLVATVTTRPAGPPGWVAPPGRVRRSGGAGLRAGLLDRFDLVVAVVPPALDLLGGGEPSEPSAVVAARVAAARRRARDRSAALGFSGDLSGESTEEPLGAANGRLVGPALRILAPLAPGAARLLQSWLSGGEIGVRGAVSLQRVARTIADLTGGEERVSADHLAAARALRQVESAWFRP